MEPGMMPTMPGAFPTGLPPFQMPAFPGYPVPGLPGMTVPVPGMDYEDMYGMGREVDRPDK